MSNLFGIKLFGIIHEMKRLGVYEKRLQSKLTHSNMAMQCGPADDGYDRLLLETPNVQNAVRTYSPHAARARFAVPVNLAFGRSHEVNLELYTYGGELIGSYQVTSLIPSVSDALEAELYWHLLKALGVEEIPML